ncbi:MAG TPA: hypothetical protein VFF16_02020 [Telluria sp.]|nr:hypothetical protein [Telluria sp.]
MNFSGLYALTLNEARLRLRRTSSLVAVLAVIALAWAMIADPAGGTALLVVRRARVLYTSSALAVGSASLASLLFGLAGFYLVRGRAAEDLRSGIGAVIGATAVSNARLLTARWLGGVAYLAVLAGGFTLAIFACHALRGEGPIQPLVYLETYALLLGPMILFSASCALLFDSVPALMGKAGDVLWFVLWAAQLGTVVAVIKNGGAAAVLPMIDFSGLSLTIGRLIGFLHTEQFALGGSPFDAALAPWRLPDQLWTWHSYLLRAGSAVLALLPLLPAAWLFHRFSPDRVKPANARRRRSPLALINVWLRPAARAAQPLFALAARIGGLPGQVLADAALTTCAAPLLIAAAGVAWSVSWFLPAPALNGAALGFTVLWALSAADLGTRDYAADLEGFTGAMPGGPVRRFARQWLAALVLGLVLLGPAVLRWTFAAPQRALAAPAGLALLAACIVTFGRCTRTTRTFVGLFLFGLYVSVNAPGVALLDAVGANGSATAASAGWHALAALLVFSAGWWWNRRPHSATR